MTRKTLCASGLAAAFGLLSGVAVGGPLDGVYSDAAAINMAWSKFAKAQGIDGQHRLETGIVDLSEAGARR
ncbi:MAG TPA: hypothetical protein VM639_13095 [Dongiaceae bacterium]|nr:hypothetical protein [Dongiaceae bacterium]